MNGWRKRFVIGILVPAPFILCLLFLSLCLCPSYLEAQEKYDGTGRVPAEEHVRLGVHELHDGFYYYSLVEQKEAFDQFVTDSPPCSIPPNHLRKDWRMIAKDGQKARTYVRKKIEALGKTEFMMTHARRTMLIFYYDNHGNILEFVIAANQRLFNNLKPVEIKQIIQSVKNCHFTQSALDERNPYNTFIIRLYN